MSKKRNVAYVKPQEPSFLKKLKQDAGYVEGPTIDTKREEPVFDSNSEDEQNDEQPVIVVLKPGDLTAEEAAEEKAKKEEDLASAPADLTQKIVFQKPVGSKKSVECNTHKNSRKSKKATNKQLLSFNQEEEDEI